MVSPVRIRVPPLKKYLDNREKIQVPVSTSGPRGNSRATVDFNGFAQNDGSGVPVVHRSNEPAGIALLVGYL